MKRLAITVLAVAFTLPTVAHAWLIGPNVDAVKDRLKDPYSAKFESVKKQKNGAVCGEVNSKNLYGAYTGRKPFVIWKGRAFIGDDATSFYFLYCLKSAQCKNDECVNAIAEADLPLSQVSVCESKECVEQLIEFKLLQKREEKDSVRAGELQALIQKQCLSYLPEKPDLMISCNSKLVECRGIDDSTVRVECLENASQGYAANEK